MFLYWPEPESKNPIPSQNIQTTQYSHPDNSYNILQPRYPLNLQVKSNSYYTTYQQKLLYKQPRTPMTKVQKNNPNKFQKESVSLIYETTKIITFLGWKSPKRTLTEEIDY